VNLWEGEDDGRTRTERIIHRAMAAREMQEPQRRRAVKSLVHDRYRTWPDFVGPHHLFPDAGIFLAAYADPSGRDYWLAWMHGADNNFELAGLLATHMARNEDEFIQMRTRLGNEILGRSGLNFYELAKLSSAETKKPDSRAVVGKLIDDPNTRHLMPVSLASALRTQSNATLGHDYRYRDLQRSLPGWFRESDGLREYWAHQALVLNRLEGGTAHDDEAIVRQHGFSSLTDYWKVWLSEPHKVTDFAHRLGVQFIELPETMSDAPKAGILSALRAARDAGEPWFIEVPEKPDSGKLKHPYRRVGNDYALVIPEAPDPFLRLMVRPRDAALWLLSKPRWRHLVPPSLAKALAPAPRKPQTLREAFMGPVIPPELLEAITPKRLWDNVDPEVLRKVMGPVIPPELAERITPKWIEAARAAWLASPEAKRQAELESMLDRPLQEPQPAPKPIPDASASAPADAGGNRRTGPKPVEMERVMQAMRGVDASLLRDMKLSEMGALFKAKQTTVREARIKLLSKLSSLEHRTTPNNEQ